MDTQRDTERKISYEQQMLLDLILFYLKLLADRQEAEAQGTKQQPHEAEALALQEVLAALSDDKQRQLVEELLGMGAFNDSESAEVNRLLAEASGASGETTPPVPTITIRNLGSSTLNATKHSKYRPVKARQVPVASPEL